MKYPSLTPAIVAIDGPAASGKSTISFRLAALTNFLFFDTGVMYRAVTWAVLNAQTDPSNQDAVGKVAQTIEIDIQPPGDDAADGRQNSILVNESDITWLIRTPKVDQNVSFIAANPLVREALTAKQRRIAQAYGSGDASKPGIIMVGRDMGTVVVPDAPIKIYLSATAEARAKRRFLEQSQRDKSNEEEGIANQQSTHQQAAYQQAAYQQAAYQKVLEDIRMRDQRDSQRTHAPLRPAEDAHIIDTSDMTIDEVVESIMALLKNTSTRWRKSLHR